MIMPIFQNIRSFVARTRLYVGLLPLVVAGIAQGQTYTDLLDFSGTNGASPIGPVTFDKAGNSYWVIQVGGLHSAGRVISRSSAGAFSVVHDFGGTITNANGKTGPDGAIPVGGVTFDSSGNLYGVTTSGGPNGGGIVWKITTAGVYSDLHDFGGTVTLSQGVTGPDGTEPQAGVVFDHSGNFYGTTQYGGPYNATYGKSLGIVWEMTAAGKYVVLHQFGGTVTLANGKSGLDGGNPASPVTLDSAGNLYGTTYDFGPLAVPSQAVGAGNVWKLTPSGVYSDLHDFGGTVTNTNGQSGPDGANLIGGATLDSSGNVFGTATNGGIYNAGVLFEITAGGVYKDLHDFGASSVAYANGTTAADGRYPRATLTLDPNGNLLGTASQGGPYVGMYGFGVSDLGGALWEIPASGTYRILHAFGGQITLSDGTTGFDGMQPNEVTFDAAGNLLGGTYSGGPFGVSYYGYGMLWQLSYTTLSSVSVSPSSVIGGSAVTGTVTLSAPAPASGSIVALSSSNASVTVPSSVTVQAGHSSATFTVNTLAVSQSASATITASLAGIVRTATLTVGPATSLKLSLNPTSIYGSTTSTGTITIPSAAGSSGIVVNLTSSSSAASVPATVTIPAGATTATFTVNSAPVSTSTTATLTGKIGVNSATADLTIKPAILNGITLNPSSVPGGGSSTATVSLNYAAGPSGALVQLSSNNSGAQVPTSVFIAAGATSVNCTITTSTVSSAITATITASQVGQSATATLTISPVLLSAVSINPNAVIGGQSATGTLSLKSAAPKGGITVALNSSNSCATVPATISIPAGASSATFGITTTAVTANVFDTITATQSGSSVVASLSVMTLPLNSLSLSPNSVVGGAASTGTVSLNYPALAGGISVNLNSSSTAATVPSSITVPAGATSATFNVTTSGIGSAINVTITASQGTVTKTATLTINPPLLTSVTVAPISVVGGVSATGSVTVNSVAPAGGLSVSLTSSNSNASVPSSVVIPAGATSAQFPITTNAVPNAITATISAILGGVTQTATLTVSPPGLASLTLSPNVIYGGATSTGKVTLSSPAPQYGLVVNLSTNNTSAILPSYVFVAAGASTATFTVTAANVSTSTSATITGTVGASTQSALLTIKALVITSLTLSPSTVHGGTNVIGTVTLSGPAGIYGASVSLASNNPAAAIYSSVYVAPGATTASFTIYTAPVASPIYVTISALMNGSGQYAGLVINP